MAASLIERNNGNLWDRLVPWLCGAGVSSLLFIGVVISGRPTETPSEKEKVQIAEAVVLPPPPPVEREKPPENPLPRTPVKLDFHSQNSKESIALLDVQIRPEKDQQILNKLNLDLDSFKVTMDEVNNFFVYNRSDVDDPPKAVHQPFPKVPGKLKSTKERRVRVMFYVNEFGRVESPYVIETSNPELNEIVLETLKTWRYSPAKKGKKAVRCWVRTAIIFSPQNSSPFSL